MSSGRLFRSECFSAFRICSFSVRQRLHHLDSLLYDCALMAIDVLPVWLCHCVVNSFFSQWTYIYKNTFFCVLNTYETQEIK